MPQCKGGGEEGEIVYDTCHNAAGESCRRADALWVALVHIGTNFRSVSKNHAVDTDRNSINKYQVGHTKKAQRA